MAPHQEITADKNAEINATLTRRAWGLFAIVDLRAKRAEIVETLPEEYSDVYDPHAPPSVPEKVLEEVEHHLRTLIKVARRTSGSIDGEQRKDLVEAVKNQSPSVLGVGLASTGSANGGDSHAQGDPKL